MLYKLLNNEFSLFQDYIEKNCGIHLEESKSYLIENRLSHLLMENNCKTFIEFFSKLRNDNSKTLRDKIIDAITTNETFWFRDIYPFDTLSEKLLPIFADDISSGKRNKIRIWSAACSTGQEPYSIAMSIFEYLKHSSSLRPEHFEIIASDISESVLNIAQTGIYDPLVISRGLMIEMRERYFNQEGNFWKIKDNIKKIITFKKLNLQDSYNTLGKIDIVFCRNVLIYFSDIFKKDILKKIAAVLKPSGYLFIGSSESVSNYSSDYNMNSHKKAMYYQVK
jgi:chemotaxis protein methyltransferase CheR